MAAKPGLDAAVAGPGGVCVVEVEHGAGDVFGTENAAAWRQARLGKGGRRIEKSVPNPVAQNRRQVAIVRAALQSAGAACPVWGALSTFFQTPMRVCMRTRQSLCRAQTPCAVPCAARRPRLSRSQQRAAVQALARRGQPAPLSAPQPGQSTKGISACFFCGTARRACPLPPLKNKKPMAAMFGLAMGLLRLWPFLRHSPHQNSSFAKPEKFHKNALAFILCV